MPLDQDQTRERPRFVPNEDFIDSEDVNAAETTEAQGMRNLNRKRTYDAYQHPDLEGIRSTQRFFESSAAQLQKELASINNVTLQALQNAVTFTNKVNMDAADNA